MLTERKDYDRIFSPDEPLSERRYLVGRDYHLSRIRSLMRRGTKCPVITGTRGIGKTSLAFVAVKECKQVVETYCHSNTTFDNWARGVLAKLDIDVLETETIEEIEGGVELKVRFILQPEAKAKIKRIIKRESLFRKKVEPDSFLEILIAIPGELVLTIDEFDILAQKHKAEVELFAEFAKLLSNKSREHSIRMIFLGVSSASRRLFQGHKSVYRNLAGIHLKRIGRNDIKEFFEKVQKDLRNVLFDHHVIDEFWKDSLGFPHYLQLVGWQCVAKAEEQSSEYPLKVGINEYLAARQSALDEVFGGIFSNYEFVRANKKSLESQVIRVLCADSDGNASLKDIERSVAHLGVTSAELKSVYKKMVKNKLAFYFGNEGTLKLREPYIIPFLRIVFEKKTFQDKAPDQLRLFNL